jgi:hypothetical protein
MSSYFTHSMSYSTWRWNSSFEYALKGFSLSLTSDEDSLSIVSMERSGGRS